MVAFKGLNVIFGLYKCTYSLTRGTELCIWPFEGNDEVDGAPGENELDTPAIEFSVYTISSANNDSFTFSLPI